MLQTSNMAFLYQTRFNILYTYFYNCEKRIKN